MNGTLDFVSYNLAETKLGLINLVILQQIQSMLKEKIAFQVSKLSKFRILSLSEILLICQNKIWNLTKKVNCLTNSTPI